MTRIPKTFVIFREATVYFYSWEHEKYIFMFFRRGLHMEDKKRPPQEMLGLLAGTGPWILPDFLDQRAKFFKNRKIKNTPSILISFKMLKKLQKIKKVKFLCFLMIFAAAEQGD